MQSVCTKLIYIPDERIKKCHLYGSIISEELGRHDRHRRIGSALKSRIYGIFYRSSQPETANQTAVYENISLNPFKSPTLKNKGRQNHKCHLRGRTTN